MPDDRILLKGRIEKVDLNKKVAYGWAYVSKANGEQVVDWSSQVWDIEEVRKTAHLFLTDCRTGGEMHISKGGATLVESIVFTKDIQDALGIDLNKEGWFVGFRVEDDELLKKVENGDYPMFSIGGIGIEEEI